MRTRLTDVDAEPCNGRVGSRYRSDGFGSNNRLYRNTFAIDYPGRKATDDIHDSGVNKGANYLRDGNTYEEAPPEGFVFHGRMNSHGVFRGSN